MLRQEVAAEETTSRSAALEVYVTNFRSVQGRAFEGPWPLSGQPANSLKE